MGAANIDYNLQHPSNIYTHLEVFMTKAAIPEQRRAQRIAKRNRQRTIIGIIVLLVVVFIGFLVYRDYSSKSQTNPTYPIGTLDSTPRTPSTSAVTTASGLIYEDLQVGDGATAESGNTVTVNYTGWLADGTKFDSSIDQGKTFDFTLGTGGGIAGWEGGGGGKKGNRNPGLVFLPTF